MRRSSAPALYKSGADPRLTKVGKFSGNITWMSYLSCECLHWTDGFHRSSSLNASSTVERCVMKHDPRYRYLYQIRPGVTSYATLYNGYTDTMEKMLRRLRFDLFYLEHRSWWFDSKILLMTFMSIVFGKKF